MACAIFQPEFQTYIYMVFGDKHAAFQARRQVVSPL